MTCLCGCTCVLSHCHLCKANHFLFLKVKPTHHLGCTLPPLFQWYTARMYQLCLPLVILTCTVHLFKATVNLLIRAIGALTSAQSPTIAHLTQNIICETWVKPNGLFFKTWNPLMIYFFQSPPPPQHIANHHHHHLPPLNAVLVLTKEARPAWSSNEYITRRIFLLIS